MTFIYGGGAGGMGIYYKIHSAMPIIYPGIVPQYVLNKQFFVLMTFIYGGAAGCMGIYSERGTKKTEPRKINIQKWKSYAHEYKWCENQNPVSGCIENQARIVRLKNPQLFIRQGAESA